MRNFTSMLKKAKEAQEKLAYVKAELAEITCTGEAAVALFLPPFWVIAASSPSPSVRMPPVPAVLMISTCWKI